MLGTVAIKIRKMLQMHSIVVVHCRWDIALVRNDSRGSEICRVSREDSLDASGIATNLIMPRVSNRIVAVVVVLKS